MVKTWTVVASCLAIFVTGGAAVGEIGRFETLNAFLASPEAAKYLSPELISDLSRDSSTKARQLQACTNTTEKPKQAAPIQAFMTPGAVSDEYYVLCLTLLRVALILYVGPCILFFSNHLGKVTSLFQAMTVNGIWSWWFGLQQIAYIGDIPPVLEGFFQMAFLSGTTALTMMLSHELKITLRGALLAYTFIMQQVDMVEIALMTWAGCDEERNMAGLAIRNQQYDAWLGCSKESEYYLAMWIIKVLQWTTIAIGAVIALKCQKAISMAAGAMLGAEVVASGIQAFFKDVYALGATDEEVAELQLTFLTLKIMICYILFGLGFAAQFCLWPEEIKDLEDYHWAVRPAARLKCMMPPLLKLEGVLSRGVASIVASGEQIVHDKTQQYIKGPKDKQAAPDGDEAADDKAKGDKQAAAEGDNQAAAEQGDKQTAAEQGDKQTAADDKAEGDKQTAADDKTEAVV